MKLLSEQMVISYKQQGLPVPPWRTRQALLSKWSPPALAELAAKIRNVRRMSFDMGASHHTAAAGAHGQNRLCNGARPAAAHASHAAVGSAPPAAETASTGEAVQAFTAAASAAGVGQHLSQEQLMAILPSEMKKQLLDLTACNAQSTAAAGQSAVQAAAAEYACKASQMEATLSCGSSSEVRPVIPISAVAGALPVAGVTGGAQVSKQVGAAAAVAAPGNAWYQLPDCSPAAMDVLALLKAADSPDCSPDNTGSLKFTRKASAEWKHNRSNGRKIKGLLAAALKRPPCSRSNLAPAPATNGSSNRACYDVPAAGQQQTAGVSAATPVFCSHPHVGDHTGSDALIRRTRYRTGGEEPWRHITTVKLGAYAPQQAAGQQATAQHAVRQN